MDFLYKFGFSNKTTQFIQPHYYTEKGKLIFPFFSLLNNQQCSAETIFIDKSIRNAQKGLLVIEYEPYALITHMFLFDNVINMLTFFDYGNHVHYQNAVFVVIPTKPSYLEVQQLLDTYKHCQHFTFIFNNDLVGICKKILMTSYIGKKENVKIQLKHDHIQVDIDNEINIFEYLNFNFDRFLSLYQLPKWIKSLSPKKLKQSNY